MGMLFRASEEFICSQLATAGNERAVVFTEDRRIPCYIANYNGDHSVVITDGADNYEELSVCDITNIHISRDPRAFGYRP